MRSCARLFGIFNEGKFEIDMMRCLILEMNVRNDEISQNLNLMKFRKFEIFDEYL